MINSRLKVYWNVLSKIFVLQVIDSVSVHHSSVNIGLDTYDPQATYQRNAVSCYLKKKIIQHYHLLIILMSMEEQHRV